MNNFIKLVLGSLMCKFSVLGSAEAVNVNEVQPQMFGQGMWRLPTRNQNQVYQGPGGQLFIPWDGSQFVYKHYPNEFQGNFRPLLGRNAKMRNYYNTVQQFQPGMNVAEVNEQPNINEKGDKTTKHKVITHLMPSDKSKSSTKLLNKPSHSKSFYSDYNTFDKSSKATNVKVKKPETSKPHPKATNVDTYEYSDTSETSTKTMKSVSKKPMTDSEEYLDQFMTTKPPAKKNTEKPKTAKALFKDIEHLSPKKTTLEWQKILNESLDEMAESPEQNHESKNSRGKAVNDQFKYYESKPDEIVGDLDNISEAQILTEEELQQLNLDPNTIQMASGTIL